MSKHLLVYLFIFSIIGCSKDKNAISDDEVLFLELRIDRQGRLLEGETRSENIAVCFPMDYFFNRETRELIGQMEFPINRSLKVIFGTRWYNSGQLLATPSHLGFLYGYTEIPSAPQTGESFGFKVDKIDDGGLVHFSIAGHSPFRLAVNQTLDFMHLVDTVLYTMPWGDVRIEITENHQFINNGMLDKGNIINVRMH